MNNVWCYRELSDRETYEVGYVQQDVWYTFRGNLTRDEAAILCQALRLRSHVHGGAE
jgi:hypothetical protein